MTEQESGPPEFLKTGQVYALRLAFARFSLWLKKKKVILDTHIKVFKMFIEKKMKWWFSN